MLTPIGTTNSAFWNAIKSGNPTHIKMTFEGQNIVLTDEDISYNEGLEITDILNSDTDLVFGKAVSKQITVGVIRSDKIASLVWTGEFKLEIGVEISSVTYWVQIGYFSGEKPNNVTTVPVINYTAYDRMKKFDVLADDFVSTISFPATLYSIYGKLCDYVHVVKIAGDELSNNKNRSFASFPIDVKGYTCRDILSWIAEACGCYVKINEYGWCKMVWFTDNTAHSITGDEEFSIESGDINDGMIWNEADTCTWDEIWTFTWDDLCGFQEEYKIEKIKIQLTEDDGIYYAYPPDAQNGNTYLIVNNPFLKISTGQDIDDYIVPIYNRLTSFGGYLPFTASCIGDCCVEAGDIITISIGANSFTVPIFVKTLYWNGAIRDVYETTAQKDRNEYTSDKNRQTLINSNEIKFYVEDNYYHTQSGIDIVPEGIDISGSRYVKIHSGGTFDVDSDNMIVDSVEGIFETRFYDSNVQDTISFIIGETYDLPASYYAKIAPTTVYGGQILTYPLRFSIIDPVSISTSKIESYLHLGARNVYRNGVYITEPSLHFFAVTTDKNTHQVDPDMSKATIVSDIMRCDDLYAENIDVSNDGVINNLTYRVIQQQSSRDIKHSIVPLESVGETLDRLKPVTYVYDDDPSEQTRMGLIYEDTMEAMPEICTEDEGNKAISYVELIPALLKEIQDLRKRVAQLEGGI